MGQPASRRRSVDLGKTGFAGAASAGSDLGSVPWDPAPELALQPGRIVGLAGPAGSGLTSLGMAMVAAATRSEPVAVLDGRGWFCPSVAWEAGVEPDRLVVVRCFDPALWPQVAAVLAEGFVAVYADMPERISERAMRRLAAVARSRRSGMVLRSTSGALSSVYLRLDARGVRWEGCEEGHGRLERRVFTVVASGKGVRGIEREVMVEGDGAHTLRLVPRLAPASVGRAVG